MSFSKNEKKSRFPTFWTLDQLQKQLSPAVSSEAFLRSVVHSVPKSPKINNFLLCRKIKTFISFIPQNGEFRQKVAHVLKMKSECSSRKQHFFSHFEQFQLKMRWKVQIYTYFVVRLLDTCSNHNLSILFSL